MASPSLSAPLLALTATTVLASTLMGCGSGSADTVATPTPAAPQMEAGPEIPPVPRGTPGDEDPSHLAPPEDGIAFELDVLEHPDLSLLDPTRLAFGPDGRLYVVQLNGEVKAITLDERGAVTAVEVVVQHDAVQDALGLAFNPNDPPEPVTIYVAHTKLFDEQGPPYAGTISTFTAPEFEREDIVTGLPVSTIEHGTNGLAFDADGRLLIAQGGVTNAGLPSKRNPRPETPLSGAILIADIRRSGFDGEVRYDPPSEVSSTVDQIGGDVRVYAAGFRNPFDLVVHSNGRVYATDNGPNLQDGAQAVSCTEGGDDPWSPDELNLVLEGHYYGHPNPNRGRFDERQCVYRFPDDTSGASTPPIATLGYSTSANGLAEYTADAFGGRMRGDLVYVEWRGARLWRVLLADDGGSVASISQLWPERFNQPLDVAVGPDGSIYISEFGGDRISVLRPKTDALVD